MKSHLIGPDKQSRTFETRAAAEAAALDALWRSQDEHTELMVRDSLWGRAPQPEAHFRRVTGDVVVRDDSASRDLKVFVRGENSEPTPPGARYFLAGVGFASEYSSLDRLWKAVKAIRGSDYSKEVPQNYPATAVSLVGDRLLELFTVDNDGGTNYKLKLVRQHAPTKFTVPDLLGFHVSADGRQLTIASREHIYIVPTTRLLASGPARSAIEAKLAEPAKYAEFATPLS